MMIFLTVVLLLLVAIPLLMTARNIKLYEKSPESLAEDELTGVSVLIPARNEEARISKLLDGVSRWTHKNFEVLIMDDHSEDRTREVVSAYAVKDPRIRLLSSADLPVGWNGKMHACWQLAQNAKYENLLFLDADVQIEDAALVRLIAFFRVFPKVQLLSIFPKQITRSLSETMFIPMMHYLLLAYLPFEQMRLSPNPAFAAGCGQMMFARKQTYLICKGHEAIKNSRHDGIALPRVFRQHGFLTDIVNGEDLASTRMYEGLTQVLRGLTKNASEGIAHPKRLPIFSVLLLGGSVIPFILFAYTYQNAQYNYLWVLYLAMAFMCVVPMYLIKKSLRLSWINVLLHPIVVLLFTCIQWWAFISQRLGQRVAWRGRSS